MGRANDLFSLGNMPHVFRIERPAKSALPQRKEVSLENRMTMPPEPTDEECTHSACLSFHFVFIFKAASSCASTRFFQESVPVLLLVCTFLPFSRHYKSTRRITFLSTILLSLERTNIHILMVPRAIHTYIYPFDIPSRHQENAALALEFPR